MNGGAVVVNFCCSSFNTKTRAAGGAKRLPRSLLAVLAGRGVSWRWGTTGWGGTGRGRARQGGSRRGGSRLGGVERSGARLVRREKVAAQRGGECGGASVVASRSGAARRGEGAGAVRSGWNRLAVGLECRQAARVASGASSSLDPRCVVLTSREWRRHLRPARWVRSPPATLYLPSPAP